MCPLRYKETGQPGSDQPSAALCLPLFRQLRIRIAGRSVTLFVNVLIELFDRRKHNLRAVKDLLALAVGSPTIEELTQLLNDFYTSERHSLFLALQDDTINGIIGIDYTARPHGLITHLAVKTEMQRRGIGKNLINHIIKTCKLSDIEAETDQDAVDFYSACGFTAKEINSRWPGVHRFRCSKDIKASMC